MQYYLCQVLFSLFISIIITITTVNAQTQDNILYNTCNTPFQCGNLKNISYPFWGAERPPYCGHPSFFVICINQTLHLRTGQLDYQILQIDTNSQSLTVSRSDYFTTICPYLLFNTTFDQNIYAYASNVQNITLYYGCPTPIQSSGNLSTPANSFICGINNTFLDGYFLTGILNTSSVNISLTSCDDNVIVPVMKSAGRFVESSPSESNLIEALNQGFGLQWIANNSLCDTCTSSGGLCGHNTTTNSFSCYCSDRNHPFACPTSGVIHICIHVLATSLFVLLIVLIAIAGFSSKFAISSVEAILVSAAASCIFVVCCCCCCFSRRGRFWVKSMFFGWKKTEEEKKIEAFMMNYQSLLANRYSYWGLTKITNSFSSKLGKGGFGSVYKGKLADGRLVAVKLLNKSAGDGEDFINEVASISRTSHVNIVNLLGFCFERSRRALVYEYMPNGSLDNHINDRGDCHLEWKTLYEIAVGIARGLEYLHRGCNTRIVHFDIKPHNILLDENFCPKISDFGLAKLCKGKESIVSTLGGARGTAGYIAPEVFMRSYGGVSYKSDVYSYGMMILEMFGGKSNMDGTAAASNSSEVYFSDWIYNHLQPGEISRIHGNLTGEEEETVRRMIIIGLWCIQTNPLDRPSMTKVVEMLEGNNSVESLQIPPKPFLYSNTSDVQCNFDSTTTSSLSVYGLSMKEEEKSFVAVS